MTKLKTIPIGNKNYVEVHTRIKYFRENFKNCAILTELVSDTDGKCIFKASALVDDKIIATGYAYEREGAGNINKTSYIENCETSAVGRCLGLAGVGIDGSVASFEEVQNAIIQQKEIQEMTDQYIGLLNIASDNEDFEGLSELLEEIKPTMKKDIWDGLTPQTKTTINDLKSKVSV